MAATVMLSVPGTLRYRDLAVSVVSEAARLVACSDDARDAFGTAVIAAFSEIFNNVAIHAYQRKGGGTIDIAIKPTDRELVIEVADHGNPFDLGEVPPLPSDIDEHSLPEGGMGIYIAKKMLDEVSYEPGPPNLWRLCKRLPGGVRANTRV